jgi:class 3 adenylate cyclase
MNTDVRFCTTDDGVHIAYSVVGDGPWIVCCPDAIGSFALDHLIPDQMGFWNRLWHGRRVVRFDMRGTGLSQRDVADVSHQALVRDLAAVVAASGAQAFTLWASTLSGPRAIDYVSHHPDAARRLILHRTFALAADVISADQVQNFAQLARVNWKMAAQVFADLPVRRELPEAGVNQAQLYIQSTSGDLVARLLVALFETADVRALLPAVRVPTLVMHRTDDPMFPFRVAQDLAARIPNARLAPLAEGIMSYLSAGRLEELFAVLDDFIDDGAQPPARTAKHSPALQTLLFTDLVGHTTMMRRLGDERGRAVLREHERMTRELLRRFGGAEIKTLGDGFMAAFASVTDALDCAIALQRAFHADGATASILGEEIGVRVGLDAGEPLAEDGDLFGSTVIMASRICARADAGEILIPEPLRHLLSGKRYVYTDRGETVLKGFEDAVRLFEVRWRE